MLTSHLIGHNWSTKPSFKRPLLLKMPFLMFNYNGHSNYK